MNDPYFSSGQPVSGRRWALALLTRMHFYVGVLVGPFLLIAAVSGIAYALTPQIEDMVYRHELYTDSSGPAGPLEEQIESAMGVVGEGGRLLAVRPAPSPGTTTRVMFVGPDYGPSESRAVFVDPVTMELRGELDVYGTSGVLPIRAWLDLLHRGLHMGDFGRLYSELAASWLWIAAMGGLVMWTVKARRKRRATKAAAGHRTTTQRVPGWHSTIGVWAFLGVLFFSVTGLTWSQYAGNNISVLRAHYGWGTPSVSTSLNAIPDAPSGDHAHHHADVQPVSPAAPALFDAVLLAARAAGIESGKVEIRPPGKPDRAWTVTEIDRHWPTHVDAVAVDPRTMTVVDHIYFANFSLPAKLTRWGIDAHMGALFGLANQLVLLIFASALSAMIGLGYIMWWRRRPGRKSSGIDSAHMLSLFSKGPPAGIAVVAIVVSLIGWFLPVMGVSLVVFLLIDWLCACYKSFSRGPAA